MIKALKKILIALAAITAAIIAGVLIYSHNRTYLNEETLIGNTAGNIYNGGLFCERDGKIYFSNDNDEGSLYVMNSDCTDFYKISNDKAVFINADGNYIYYVRANNTRESNTGFLAFNNTGIYRINQNGSNIMAISYNPGSYLSLFGNYVYYQNYDVENGLYLYREKIDGTLNRVLVKDAVIPATVKDNRLFYTGFSSDHNINMLDLSSYITDTFLYGNIAFPIIQEEYIYYIDMENNYSINRIRPDGSEETVLADGPCSSYNITNSGRYLYYQIDDADSSRLCRYNLAAMEEEIVIDGNYKNIHVTDNYVFFKNFDNRYIFIQKADGKLELSTFNPPSLVN